MEDRRTEERLTALGQKLVGEKRVVIGDWNAHHELWSCEGTQGNARGRQIVEWMEAEGLHVTVTLAMTRVRSKKCGL